LAIYAVAGLASALAPSFAVLIAARAVQGFGAGAARVVAVSIARDRYRGAEMARVMSLVTMTFLVVPILAPSIGQVMLWVASWRWIFVVLAVAGAALALWARARLDETLDPANRRALTPRAVAAALREVVTTRATAVPMLAMATASGALMAYVTSSQQVFQDGFGVGASFALLFALIAVTMSAAAFANARLVRRVGPARLARRALHAMIATSALAAALAVSDRLSLPAFELLSCLTMMSFGFVGSNLNAVAMEPMGHLAGTASSVIGAVSTVASAILGGVVGHLFDGTARPLLVATLVLAVVARGLLLLAPTVRPPRPA
jgi:DHA1 family bicyclomycin/chloramphenicol resistance-like MFS transporter